MKGSRRHRKSNFGNGNGCCCYGEAGTLGPGGPCPFAFVMIRLLWER
jgi:hypothetical protein